MSQGPNPADTLIMGTAYGYSTDQVRTFVESLRRHFAGETILLVTSRAAPDTIAFLKTHDITPVFFDCPAWMVADIQIARYIRYAEILRTAAAAGKLYSRVLLTDVADVLFQGDPFDGAPAGDLLCFQEYAERRIGQCPANSAWIQHIFGDAEVQKLKDAPIYCSGTTIGTPAAILDYIDRMMRIATPEVLGRLGNYRGHDQGILNYLIQHRQLPSAHLIPNGTHVFTLGGVPAHLVRTAANGHIITSDGRVCPIIHQYNYHPHTHQVLQPSPQTSAPSFFTATGKKLV